MNQVIVSGSFDDLRSPGMRFLQESARLGSVHVMLWADEAVRANTGREPKFPQAERGYLLEAVRYVSQVSLLEGWQSNNELPLHQIPRPAAWVVTEAEDNELKRAFCRENNITYHVIPDHRLTGFPFEAPDALETHPERKKVVVTGCYDWLHSGHVRFFEEVSQLGSLYVVVGHDENVRLLKGAGHPLFGQNERCYMAQSICYVTAALISSGTGWMDAEPEIERIRPDIYAVNQDGDKPVKRAFCAEHGLEYVVLQRLPKAGLPRRESTNLRGF